MLHDAHTHFMTPWKLVQNFSPYQIRLVCFTLYSSSTSFVHHRILNYSDKARTIPRTTLQLGYYRLHSFWHYCRLYSQLILKMWLAMEENTQLHASTMFLLLIIREIKDTSGVGWHPKGRDSYDTHQNLRCSCPVQTRNRTQSQSTSYEFLLCTMYKYHIWEWVLYGSGSPHTHTLELAYNSDSPGNKSTTKFSYCRTRRYMETVKV